jgi:hypothetical protein
MAGRWSCTAAAVFSELLLAHQQVRRPMGLTTGRLARAATHRAMSKRKKDVIVDLTASDNDDETTGKNLAKSALVENVDGIYGNENQPYLSRSIGQMPCRNQRSNDSHKAFPGDKRQGNSYAVYLNIDEKFVDSEQELLHVLQFALLNEPVCERSFSAQSVDQFYENITNGNVKVVGFSEFSYSRHGTLAGDDQQVEREYWVKVKNEALHVIVHVHYQGQWSSFQNRRDRSIITAINLRHAVPKRNPSKVPVFPLLCKAFGAWREKRKHKISVDPPWDWRHDTARLTHLRSLLVAAEECTRRVRSLDFGSVPSIAPGPWGADGARRALILAVNDYVPPAPSLQNPILDAINLQKALLDLGWEVNLSFAPPSRPRAAARRAHTQSVTSPLCPATRSRSERTRR